MRRITLELICEVSKPYQTNDITYYEMYGKNSDANNKREDINVLIVCWKNS